MPVEFASATVIELPKEDNFVLTDKTGLPARVMGSRERALLCRSCADVMRGFQEDEDAGGAFQSLKLKDAAANGRLLEAMRGCEAYRLIDKLDDLNSRSQHRIDLLV